MSTSGAAYSQNRGSAVIGAASVGPRADGAEVEVMTGLSSKFGSLMSGGGEGQGRAAAVEHEDTSSTRKGHKEGTAMGHAAGYVFICWCQCPLGGPCG